MQRKNHLPTRQTILADLKRLRGNVTALSEQYGCDRATIYRRIGAEAVQAVRNDADNWRVDIALLKLDQALNEGERWAVEKILETRGGYHQQQQHAVTILKIIRGVDEEAL